MKIAQVSPLYESTPPRTYGGTERVVAYMCDALTDLGHDVTLFATRDSGTKAKLIPCCEHALRPDPHCTDPMALHILQLQEVVERADEFDIIHFHTDYLHFPLTEMLNIPCVTTLHGRLNMPELQLLYNKFSRQPVISISYAQRFPLSQANWVANVYHGLPKDLYEKGDGDGKYLAFIGRISPEKRVDRAIEIAIKTGKKLLIAAKIDKSDLDYFNKEIKPLLDHPLIEYIGEIGEEEKKAFLGKAECLLFPIDWPEPFGMVMIEAMACGTPVIAFEKGSVPEIIDVGVTGYIVNSIPEAVAKVKEVSRLSRFVIRYTFEMKYSAERMARDYLKLYHKQVSRSGKLKQISAAMYRNPMAG